CRLRPRVRSCICGCTPSRAPRRLVLGRPGRAPPGQLRDAPLVPARAATPFDAPRISALLERSLHSPEAVLASALPVPYAAGTVSGVGGLVLGVAGITGRRLHVFLEQYRGQLRSAALVYDGRRPEWVVLLLAAMFEPGGADSAFRLLSGVSAAASGRWESALDATRGGAHRRRRARDARLRLRVRGARPPSACPQSPHARRGRRSRAGPRASGAGRAAPRTRSHGAGAPI